MACDYYRHERLLPPGKHIIWLDNLFTSVRVLERLRQEGIGGAGTVRTTKTPREKKVENAKKKATKDSKKTLSQDTQPTLEGELSRYH
ncbi:hypothetical protein K469DRAFT_778587 [Zopfia rhizophila CBS 207.26]|uniref:PiggyBac transposable element-derived protein domain-containing protein n=1 Tax=Zopfia rhizophila CBS 207.26 TaxID=1314779 RepID=A0A6A6E5X0_9PEZI|nr:hypothetical protein K469DRAFT_778587 [Zopfia rhizophila CBS 207.26]